MPIYRYECRQCRATFKLFQRNGNRPEVVCPECGARDAERLLPRVGVIYRGSGYYSTDYRGKARKSGTGDTTSRGGTGTEDRSDNKEKPSKASTSSTTSSASDG